MVVCQGEAATIATWARRAGLSANCLKMRLRRGEPMPFALRPAPHRTPKGLLTWADLPADVQAERVALYGRISGTTVDAYHL